MPARLLREIASVVLAAAAALMVRQYVASIYLIPSESMLPRLMPGDYLLVEKWPFARVGAHDRALPARGDVVVVRAPGRTVVKRLIGLPGDRVALRHGLLLLDGRPLPRWRVADLVVAETPATPCRPDPAALIRAEREADGTRACRYPRVREMLPDGRWWDTLDLGYVDADDFGPVTVPPGRLFLLGDNRDRSGDSRLLPARGGIGLVPSAAVIGRAGPVIFSTDGSARPFSPASWLSAMRPERLGAGGEARLTGTAPGGTATPR